MSAQELWNADFGNKSGSKLEKKPFQSLLGSRRGNISDAFFQNVDSLTFLGQEELALFTK